eukprot:COSAG05_NODE_1467_length_4795_cov_1.624574_6_plen_76_part_00
MYSCITGTSICRSRSTMLLLLHVHIMYRSTSTAVATAVRSHCGAGRAAGQPVPGALLTLDPLVAHTMYAPTMRQW